MAGGRDMKAEVAAALSDSAKVRAIRSLKLLRDARRRAIAELSDYRDLRDAASEIRSRSVSSMDELAEEFRSRLEAQGGIVHIAADGEEARAIVLSILRGRGASIVVKSKSMTSEEVGLDRYLEEHGVSVVNTDLGELAVQLSGERPVHIVAPAAHMTRYDYSRLLNEKLGLNTAPTPESITAGVREYLRGVFLRSHAAISGANFLVASTGTIALVTNEGNARLGTSVPPLYIVVAGMEKLVKSPADVGVLLELLPRSASGQRLTSYVTFTTGPQAMGDGGLQELHVVLVDNGRRRAAMGPLRDTMKCIRCGACLNACPTFNVLGGHVFGDVYPGPMGILWTAVVKGYGSAAAISELCVGCMSCSAVCPVEIPIAEMIMEVKSYRRPKFSERVLTSVELLDRLSSSVPALWELASAPRLRRWAMSAVGLDPRRELIGSPRRLHVRATPTSPQSTVVYFSDVYARYNAPEIGERLVHLLTSAGLSVHLPEEQVEAGMPYLSYGMVERAKDVAARNVAILHRYAAGGYTIVTTEPTALSMLRELYPRFLRTPEAADVAARSMSASAFILNLAMSGQVHVRAVHPGWKVFYHLPCHARSLGDTSSADLLRLAGYDVAVSDVPCCGIGGSFGYKKGPVGYDLSMAVGEELFEQARASGADVLSTDSSVCAIQLRDGLGSQPIHPLMLVSVELDG